MTEDNGMTKDWWEDILAERRLDGGIDAGSGVFWPPHPHTASDIQEKEENRAYIEGFFEEWKELGDKFEWA